MTPDEIQLVQSSFSKVAPNADAAAALFYGRLFEIAPDVRPLFKSDLGDQGKKLMSTLAVVVGGLTNLETVVPAARSLAVKHVEYGVSAEHYQPVGEALLWTLEQGLGDAFTDEVKAAWTTAYGTLSSVMIEAAYSKTTAAE